MMHMSCWRCSERRAAVGGARRSGVKQSRANARSLIDPPNGSPTRNAVGAKGGCVNNYRKFDCVGI